MINIKQVKKGDLLKLIEIDKNIFDYPSSIKDFENYFKEETIKIWKISTQKIIGFVIFYHVKNEIEIIQIGIMKSFQRKKYGSLIILSLIHISEPTRP